MTRVEVKWDDESGIWIASDDTTTVYGAGDEPDTALQDYFDARRSDREYLESIRDRLGPALVQELDAITEAEAAG